MEDSINGKTREELVELWKQLKQEKKVIDKERELLYDKINEECEEVRAKYADAENALLKSASDEVRDLIKTRNNLRKRLNHSKWIFGILTLMFFAIAVTANKVFLLELEEYFDYGPAYLIMVGVSLILAGLFTVLRNKIVRSNIYAIQNKEQMRRFNDSVSDIDIITEKEVEYVENEKYKAEMDRFSDFDKRYKSVRSFMIKEEYGDSAFFYFEKFGEFADKDVSYEIDVDGITVAYSKNEKFQRIGINPGYHTIDLTLYSDNKRFYLKFHFQVSEKNLPLCVVCNEVSAYHGDCREVAFEEFDKRYGYLIK